MAFDQRLDSDYVDFANDGIVGALLSHTPILGSLWSLVKGGGGGAGSNPNRQQHQQRQDDDNDEQEDKHPPSLASSFVSSINDQNARQDSWGSNLDNTGNENENEGPIQQQRQRKKILSWTDQSGKGNLCQYFAAAMEKENEQGVAVLAATVEASQAQAMVVEASSSALTRSRSARTIQVSATNDKSTQQVQETRHSYLPRMDPSAPGVIMPSMNKQHQQQATSVSHDISPQYGFYVNLTPPSPDMYYNKPRSNSHTSVASTATTTTTSSSAAATFVEYGQKKPTVMIATAAKPINPIFQTLLQSQERQQQARRKSTRLQQQQQQQRNQHTTAALNFPSAPL